MEQCNTAKDWLVSRKVLALRWHLNTSKDYDSSTNLSVFCNSHSRLVYPVQAM